MSNLAVPRDVGQLGEVATRNGFAEARREPFLRVIAGIERDQADMRGLLSPVQRRTVRETPDAHTDDVAR